MRRFCWLGIVLLCLLLLFAYLTLPKLPLLQGVDFSTVVYSRDHQLLRLTLAKDGQYRLFVPLNEIAKSLKQASLLQEDRYFYYHPGVNPFALIRAIWQTFVLRHRRYGASTITMQVARIRFHLNTHSILGKLKQIYVALALERYYHKADILQAYLNLVPYGGNISGVGAASLVYFSHQANQLDLSEALSLSVIPQNPEKRRPRLSNNFALQQARQHLFQRWQQYYPYTQQQQAIFRLPLEIHSVHQLPFIAPHFVNHVLTQANAQQRLMTTLDSQLQQQLSQQVKQYLAQRQAVGLNNAAVMIVDTNDMAVRAVLGSGDYFNQAIDGQIDGSLVNRSPGSALKPFIYALAIQQGLITPMTVLLDVPQDFASYSPENFDHQYMGPITAQQALIMSRNVPAVNLASRLHHPNLYDLLQSIQVTHLQPASSYGLSLALGGAEISLQKLIELYGMLANRGQWQALQYLSRPIHKPNKQPLLSPEAAFITLQMLRHNPAPLSLPNFVHLRQQLAIPWKTGTSSGYRDAWSIGVVGHYVIGVWLGNFNDRGNPSLVGRQAAAPLFFRIANALIMRQHLSVTTGFDQRGLNIKRIAVCAASGDLPTAFCPKTHQTWFIPGVSPIKKDTVYREVAINPDNGLRTCHISRKTRFKVYEFWPSNVLHLFRLAGIPRQTAPVFEAGCQLMDEKIGQPPQISSPLPNVIYHIQPSQQRIAFSATVDGNIKSLYWFINQNYLGKTSVNTPLFWRAKPGDFQVRVVDDKGRSAVRQLRVRNED